MYSTLSIVSFDQGKLNSVQSAGQFDAWLLNDIGYRADGSKVAGGQVAPLKAPKVAMIDRLLERFDAIVFSFTRPFAHA